MKTEHHLKLPELSRWKDEVEQELLGNILPFWSKMKTEEGFHGAMRRDLSVIESTSMGLVMVARILWTYSRAYKIYRIPAHLELAQHALKTLSNRFFDHKYGGFIWNLDTENKDFSLKKQTYGQAFVIYALSEYYMATEESDNLEKAFELFQLLEQKCWDEERGGYLETFEQDWRPAADMRLSDVDECAPKTMNNHLHLIEAYVNLLKANRTPHVVASSRRLIETILDKIIIPDESRFGLYFDLNWNRLSNMVSPGHDIEGSWLLWEAAEILDHEDITSRVKDISMNMAETVLLTGLDSDGGVRDEFEPDGAKSGCKTWWPQAEGAVGFYNACQLTGDAKFLDASQRVWNFTRTHIIDTEYGEWIWGIDENSNPIDKEKAGPWKAPYHNARSCMELVERISATHR